MTAALLSLKQPQQAFDKRALARTVGPQQTNYTGLDPQRNIAKCDDLSIAFGNRFDIENGFQGRDPGVSNESNDRKLWRNRQNFSAGHSLFSDGHSVPARQLHTISGRVYHLLLLQMLRFAGDASALASFRRKVDNFVRATRRCGKPSARSSRER